MTLSETWRRDNKHQIHYVQVPGYSLVFKNRKGNKRGGGVAIYLKEEFKYMERTDIRNIEPDIEHIWIEIRGKNKNCSILLGVLYQISRKSPFGLKNLNQF